MNNTSMFSGKVISKFMTAEEFNTFLEKYMANKGWARRNRPVSQQDRDILAVYKAKTPIKEIMKQFNISESKVNSAILRAVAE